jgi:hypothetical protein
MRKITTTLHGIGIAMALLFLTTSKVFATCGLTSVGTISGPTSICAGSTATYTFNGVGCSTSGCVISYYIKVFSGSTLVYTSTANTSTTHTFTPNSAGTYSVTGYVKASTTSTYCSNNTITLVANAKPSVPSSICGAISTCTNQYFSLSATPASDATIRWYKGSTLIGTGNSISRSESSAGNYTYLAYSYNTTTGCQSTNYLSATANVFQGPTNLVINSPSTASIGSAITVSGSASGTGVTYSWNFGSGASPATGTGAGPFSVTYSTSGAKTITLVVTDGNSCVAKSAKTVTVCGKAVINSLESVCVSTNIQFTASDAGTNSIYTWNFGSGATPSTGTGIGPHNVSYASTGSKTATLTVTNSANSTCTSTVTKTITVNAKPTSITITSNSTVFVNEPLTVSGSAAGTNNNFNWDFGSGATVTSTNTVQLLDNWTTATGTYSTGSYSFSNTTGSNRLLVLMVGMEHGSDLNLTAVTYGGKSMTQAVERGIVINAPSYNRIEIWYLKESDLASAGTGSKAFAFTWSGTPDYVLFSAATFKNVDQTTPIGNTSSNQDCTNPLAVSSSLAFDANDMIVFGGVSGSDGTYNSTLSGFTEGSDFANSATTALATYYKLATSSGTITPSVTFSTAVNRQGIAAMIINAATSGSTNVTYSTTGVKTIKLVVTNEFGCSDSVTKTITVCPKAIISCGTSTCTYTTTQFTAADAGTNATYTWNFGTGASPATATGLGPHNVSYSSSGSKTVTLTVGLTSTSCSSVDTKTLTVGGPSNPTITSASTVFQGTTLSVTGSATGTGLTFSWNFGTGATPATTTGAGPHNVVYSSTGTKTITLTVSTTDGCTSTITKEISVCDGYSIDGPTTSCPGSTVQFTATKVGTGGSSCGDTICWQSPTKSYVTAQTAWTQTATTVTIRTTLSKEFVDNTYGTNKIGWPGNHNFSDLTGSDKLQLALYNATGTKSMEFKIDYLSSSSAVSSGYKSLGVTGGDGGMLVGNASDVLSAVTSLDRNFNTFGYVLTTNSPATNSSYTPNSTYPNWIYEVWYEVTVNKSVFGTAGFGYPAITDVHASPSKTGNNTEVVETTPCTQYVTWNFGSGATPSTATGLGPHNVSYSSTGTKTVTLNSGTCATGNCPSTFTKTISITSGPSVTITPPAVNIFEDTTLTFSATFIAGATYAWSATGDAIITGNGNIVTIKFANSGTQTVTVVTTLNGCSGTANLTISVNQAVCSGIKLNHTQVPLKTSMKNYTFTHSSGNWIMFKKTSSENDSFHTSRKFQRNGDTAISWQELCSNSKKSTIKFNRSASDFRFSIRDLDKNGTNQEIITVSAYFNGSLISTSEISATFNATNIDDFNNTGTAISFKGLTTANNSSTSNDLAIQFTTKIDSVSLVLSNIYSPSTGNTTSNSDEGNYQIELIDGGDLTGTNQYTWTWKISKLTSTNNISHWDMVFPNCALNNGILGDILYVQYSNNGTNWNNLSIPRYKDDPSMLCDNDPGFKFDQGMSSGGVIYYRLILNSPYIIDYNAKSFWKASTNCGYITFAGIGCPSENCISDIGLSKMSWCITQPLPVSWLSINAVKNAHGGINVNWATSSEINNDHFEIEKSFNNSQFNYLGEVQGGGNRSYLSKYVFEDKTPGTGYLYYRIKQVDYNGDFKYSPVVVVNTEKLLNNVTINPNPASTVATLTWDAGIKEPLFYQITDLTGAVIASDKLPMDSNIQYIQLENLSNGLYMVNILSRNEMVYRSKIVVVR